MSGPWGLARMDLCRHGRRRLREMTVSAACAALAVLAMLAVLLRGEGGGPGRVTLADVDRISPAIASRVRRRQALQPVSAPDVLLHARAAEQSKVNALRTAIDLAKSVQGLPPRRMGPAQALAAGARLLQEELHGSGRATRSEPAGSGSRPTRAHDSGVSRPLEAMLQHERANGGASAGGGEEGEGVKIALPAAGSAVTTALLASMADSTVAASISRSISSLAQELKGLEEAISTKAQAASARARAKQTTSSSRERGSSARGAVHAHAPTQAAHAAQAKATRVDGLDKETALMEAIDRCVRVCACVRACVCASVRESVSVSVSVSCVCVGRGTDGVRRQGGTWCPHLSQACEAPAFHPASARLANDAAPPPQPTCNSAPQWVSACCGSGGGRWGRVGWGWRLGLCAGKGGGG